MPDPTAVFPGIVERNRTAGGVAMSELTKAVKAGDHRSAAVLIGTIQRLDSELAGLFGLYAPERVDVNVAATTATAMIERAEAELLALADSTARPQPQLPALPVLDAEVVG